MTYDAYGNMTFDGRHHYGYRLNGLLADIDNGSVVYKYEAFGRRLRMADMSGGNDIVTTYG